MNITMSSAATNEPAPQDHHGNPQSAAMTITRLPDKNLSTRKVMEAVMECMSAPVKQLLTRDSPLRIALVIDDTCLNDHVVSAIRNPVSTCCVDSLTVLNHRTVVHFEEETDDTKFDTKEDRFLKNAQDWLNRYDVDLKSEDILQGQTGFDEILRRDSVDAVYIFVPAELQQQYVLGALKARKHVLLKDPVSTPCDDFVEQMKYAVKGTSCAC